MGTGKNSLRAECLRARRSLAADYRQRASCKMLSRLYALPEYQKSSSVMAYVSMVDEVQLGDLLVHSLTEKKVTGVPYVLDKGLMGAARLRDLDSLAAGAYGIPTVAEDRRELLPAGSFDLVIVPGVAFSEKGSRLGMGAGFYDRFLSEREPQARRIALCFDCQLLPEIPVEDHDQRVDAIITETRFIKCR